MKLKNIVKVLSVGLMALTIVGCGGGSSSGDIMAVAPTEIETPAPAQTPTVYIDNDLGLMWQDDVYAEMTTKPWLSEANYDACDDDEASGACEDDSGDTASTYCANLVLDDYADWRLPSNDELSYLYTSDQYLNLNHIVVQDDNPGYDFQYKYWSSTPSTSWSLGAYASNEVKTSSDQAKDALYYVRCIRDL